MTLKISAVLEKQIRTQAYQPYDSFMCHVVSKDPQVDLDTCNKVTEHLRQQVRAICPTSVSLLGALGAASQPCALGWLKDDEDDFAVTLQWYCWHVFDLKRKGL